MHQAQRTLKAASTLALAAVCAACGSLPAHNNTLIFAVKRDFGAAVSTPSAADPDVSVTLGYKERQAAWVPLWANKRTGGLGTRSKDVIDCDVTVKTASHGVVNSSTTIADVSTCKRGPKFVGDGTPNDGHANGNESNDAYSTFASFGGNVKAGKDEGASGQMALASFFATGVAAQYLSKNASGLVMVTTKPDDSKDDKKISTSPAQRMAENELLALLDAISPQNTLKDPKITTKACLTKLGVEYDPKKPAQFEWLTGMTHKQAAERWAKASTFLDDEHRKLIGVAYTLHKEADKHINAAVDAALKDAPRKTAEDVEKATITANTKRTEAIEAFCAP